jgi:hypothetical protein
MNYEFIGKNGSMGLVKGKKYEVRTGIVKRLFEKPYIQAKIESSEYFDLPILCPYSSVESFMKNWELGV